MYKLIEIRSLFRMSKKKTGSILATRPSSLLYLDVKLRAVLLVCYAVECNRHSLIADK